MRRFWELLMDQDGKRVLISLVSQDLREFAYDGMVWVEMEGVASARLEGEGDLVIWIDGYSEEECILNISHRGVSEHTGVAKFLCNLPMGYEELLVRAFDEEGRLYQVWPE